MNQNQFVEKFLEEINTSCFPVNDGGNKKIREQAFLKRRFHPDNYQPRLKQNKEIAKEIQPETKEDWVTSIATTCGNVVRALVNQYGSEMKIDGVDVNSLVNGQVGKGGHWEVVYDWLHEFKFSEWLTQGNNGVWQALKAEARADIAEISFTEVDDNSRGMTGRPRQREQIYLNRDYEMEIELESNSDELDPNSDYYLLLLNRGQTLQGEETKYLVCPSLVFAPHLQPVNTQFALPQPESTFEVINFDEPGTEEYLGILVREIPNLPAWMRQTDENDLTTWDELRLYGLWQEISQQGNYVVFYRSFEIVND